MAWRGKWVWGLPSCKSSALPRRRSGLRYRQVLCWTNRRPHSPRLSSLWHSWRCRNGCPQISSGCSAWSYRCRVRAMSDCRRSSRNLPCLFRSWQWCGGTLCPAWVPRLPSPWQRCCRMHCDTERNTSCHPPASRRCSRKGLGTRKDLPHRHPAYRRCRVKSFRSCQDTGSKWCWQCYSRRCVAWAYYEPERVRWSDLPCGGGDVLGCRRATKPNCRGCGSTPTAIRVEVPWRYRS